MANERLALLATAMSELPTPMYEVIFRRFFLRQPFAEVSESLHRSPAATRVLLLRAVRKLNELISDESGSQSEIDPE